MNLIDGYVKEVLSYEVKKSSECWKLDPGEEDKEHHIYKVSYADEGGEHKTELWFNEKNDDVKEGYRFAH
ncbi:MAG: hypothetical protein E7206_17845 [Clostridium beijerinckii]|nr:hypothetical protein [Clostridium beijerinckii]